MIATKAATSKTYQELSIQPAQLIGSKPRRADLVEDFQTGKRYLRTFAGGHYYWQAVSGNTDAVPDQGVWTTGQDYYQVYWLNLGAFRRCAGQYVAIAAREAAPQAA